VAKTRVALMMLLTLRGTPLLYQGDEIGLPDTTLSHDEIVDPAGLHYWPDFPGRDPGRTPMPWSDSAGGGFTAESVKPWLPFGDLAACNVRAQREDPGSTINLVRHLIALRRRTPDLQAGDYVALPSPAGVWAWQRGNAVRVVLNFTDAPVSFPTPNARIAASTDREREGELVADACLVGPWQGILLNTEPDA
jgi:glycosidase